jgi:hypothetical protein
MQKLPNANDLFGPILLWEHLWMNSEDDAEARIRELEQPLADAARASEAGVTPPPGKWAAPSAPPGSPAQPLPPPVNDGTNFGMPFPPTAPRSFSFNRTWWIFIAAFVFFPMIITGFIAFNTSRQASHHGMTTFVPTPSLAPSTVPSSGPNTPSSTGTQAPSAGASASPPATPLPPAGTTLTVSDINANQKMACNQSIVNISGISNTVVITGHCASLRVSGSKNSITVDAVDTIEVSGVNNQVTYHSGSPSQDQSGFGNVIQQG